MPESATKKLALLKAAKENPNILLDLYQEVPQAEFTRVKTAWFKDMKICQRLEALTNTKMVEDLAEKRSLTQ